MFADSTRPYRSSCSCSIGLSAVALLTLLWLSPAATGAAESKVFIAFSSYREHTQHPQIYFYEHDTEATGKIVDNIPAVPKRSDHRASLSRDGRYCAFASEIENETSRIYLWDRHEKKLIDLPGSNDSPNSQQWPTLTGDGQTIVFTTWNRPGSSQRWDLFTYDVVGKSVSELSKLNTQLFDERMPAISADGKRLAYVTNDKAGAGLMDIVLYDRASNAPLTPKDLNSAHREVEPALSGDGNLLCFSSDRPGGVGGRDLYLFDLQAGKLLDLPGLNSVAHEQSPSLSPDGRYIAFVSERIQGAGERDIFLYDRESKKLLPTPGLNARQEDLDPCVIVVK